MFRSNVLVALCGLALFAAINCASFENQLTVIENFEEYLESTPEITFAQEMEKFSHEETGKIHYRFGKRQHGLLKISLSRFYLKLNFIVFPIPGDRAAHVSSNRFRYARPQTVVANITYPPTDCKGVNLSYVDLFIHQTNNLSKAFVTQGGIGQRFINIVVEAYYITDFSYKAEFFGHN